MMSKYYHIYTFEKGPASSVCHDRGREGFSSAPAATVRGKFRNGVARIRDYSDGVEYEVISPIVECCVDSCWVAVRGEKRGRVVGWLHVHGEGDM